MMRRRINAAIKCLFLVLLASFKLVIRRRKRGLGVHSRAYLDLENNHTLYTYPFVYNLSKVCDEILVRVNLRFLSRFAESLALLDIENVNLDVCFKGPRHADLVLSDRPDQNGIRISYNVFPIAKKSRTLQLPLGFSPAHVQKLWSTYEVLRSKKRKIRVLFCGSGFEGGAYDDAALTANFGLATRARQLKALRQEFGMKGLYYCDSRESLLAVMQSDRDDFGLVLVNAMHSPAKGADWFELVASANFFLALPGQCMPHCFNLAESMSVGTIPVTGYGDQVLPSLADGITCLAAKSEKDVISAVQRAMEMGQGEIDQMRSQVIDHFKMYISPLSYLGAIKNGDYDVIEMIAEHHSLELLQRKSL